MPPRSARSTRPAARASATIRRPRPAVRGQRGVDRVRRHRLAEFGPGGTVAVAGADDRSAEDVPGDRGEDGRVPAYADVDGGAKLLTSRFAP
jgi:hypothetical protein